MAQISSPQLVWRSSRQFPGTRSVLRWWRNCYENEIPQRGFVWIIHGIGEYGGRYAELARFLTQLGYDVLAIDLPGHGLSRSEGGQRRLVSVNEITQEFRDSMDDWLTNGPIAKRGLIHTPWYLIGHSMGSLISLNLMLEGNRFSSGVDFAKRAFLSAPPLGLRLAVPAWKLALAKKLDRVAPYFELANGINPEDLTRDAAVIAQYRNDKLIHHFASSRLFLTVTATAERILKSVQDVEIPVCLGVGAEDPVVCPKTIRSYFDKLNTHKKFVEFPKFKHEIFNELGRSSVFEAVAAWIS